MIIDELFEGPQLCPECGGISFSDLILAEKKDACYHKVKASAKVWPSAYASGRLVQCRKKGAANYGNSKNEGVEEDTLDEKSVSQAQFRTMAAAAHNPKFARKVGISQDVAQEFNQADKKSNYKKLPDRATEGEQQKGADYRDPKEVDYDDDYDAMVSRVKRLAGLGPMKTVYDPARRQYRNMPTAVQPKK